MNNKLNRKIITNVKISKMNNLSKIKVFKLH